jgi:integrase
VVEDRPYTKEEIKTLVDRAELRNKAIILIMASSGMRIGPIPELRMKDLLSPPKCRKIIDYYIKCRVSVGAEIKPESPLFRKAFDRDDLLQVRNNP